MWNQEVYSGKGRLAQLCFLSHSSIQAKPKVVFLCRAKEVTASLFWIQDEKCHTFKWRQLWITRVGESSISVQHLPWGLASLGSFSCLSRSYVASGSFSSLFLTAVKGRGYECFASKSCDHMWTLRQWSPLAGLEWMTNALHAHTPSPVQALPCPCCMCRALCWRQFTGDAGLWRPLGW